MNDRQRLTLGMRCLLACLLACLFNRCIYSFRSPEHAETQRLEQETFAAMVDVVKLSRLLESRADMPGGDADAPTGTTSSDVSRPSRSRPSLR